MKIVIPQMSRRLRVSLCTLTAIAFLPLAACSASAQWRAVDAQNAWNGYWTAFSHTEPPPDNYAVYFAKEQGQTATEGFWTFAEEIAVAEDAYYENPNSTNSTRVEALADGFVYEHTDDWSSDLYDDDLMWATIAFARAYSITGTTRWLDDAENNFATVWNRGLASNGGVYWYTAGCSGHPATGCSNTYQNSAANWTFVIAGNLLYNITGDSSYYTEKNSVYTWAKANLYDSSTGEIMDAPGVHSCQCTYNYGIAMTAGSYQGSNDMVPNIANYVFGINGPPNELTNYNGTTDGYEILPNYGQGDGNNDGFNGILMRGVGDANNYGYITSTVMAAAQANINAAWSNRNGTYTTDWNNWKPGNPTPDPSYSWDDSAAMAGLLDLPPTAD